MPSTPPSTPPLCPSAPPLAPPFEGLPQEVFCYGSLRAPEVVSALLGAPLPTRPAWHPAARVCAVRGEDFPALALACAPACAPACALTCAPLRAPLYAPGELLRLAPVGTRAYEEQIKRLDSYEELDAGEYLRVVALVWAMEREASAAGGWRCLSPVWAWCYVPGPALRGRLGGPWRFEERDALMRARGGWLASPAIAWARRLALEV